MYYKDEKTTIVADIICLIFLIIPLYLVFIAIKEYIEGKYDFIVLLSLGILLLSIAFSSGYCGISNYINSKRNRKLAKEIKEKGKKVKGKVKEILTTEKTDYKHSIFKRASYFEGSYYKYAKVKYNYNNKEYTIETPYLNFYLDDLKNKDVDVYIYEDMCYVDNYDITKKETEVTPKTALLFFGILLIYGIIIYLSINGDLDYHVSFPIIIAVMVLFILINIINRKKN